MAPALPPNCLKHSFLPSPSTTIHFFSTKLDPISSSSMEASAGRIFIKSTNRHCTNSILLPGCHPLKLSPLPIYRRTALSLSLSNPNFHFRTNWIPSLLNQSSFQSNAKPNRFARIMSGHNDKSFEWKFALDGVNGGELGFFPADNPPIVTVVLLGWLGSKQKHLRRYAELYNSLGLNAITFAASVYDVLGFDLGKKLEARIGVLTNELVSWLQEKDKDGRERFLIFHTFSNTGWLAYGSILNRLQGRQELLEKIKGCVVDSGGDSELDPKVWAAGFTAAMLKKHSSLVNSSFEADEAQDKATDMNAGEKEPLFIEVFLLTLFEKFFTYLLGFPDVNKRLKKIIHTLSKNQPCHPQLYLYSTSDKVIPYQKVESFIDAQKELGRKVTTFNFKSTPHVDHYRTFPSKYQSLIHNFLKDCFVEVNQM